MRTGYSNWLYGKLENQRLSGFSENTNSSCKNKFPSAELSVDLMPFPLRATVFKQQDTYCLWEAKMNSQVYTFESLIYRHTQTELDFPKQFFLLLYSRVVIINTGLIKDLGDNDVPHAKKFTWPLKKSISEEPFSGKSSETELLRNWERG